MQSDDFPSEEIIEEFMQEPIDMSPLQLDWCQPNVVKFVVSVFRFENYLPLTQKIFKIMGTFYLQKMMGKLIQWDEIYCFQKFLPLLTRWQLHHADSDSTNQILRGSVQPDFIKKKRTPKGVPSYEIIWKDDEGCFESLIPDDQLKTFYSTNKEKSETEALQILWSTIEPIDLVEKAYPELVSQFEESKAKGKSKKAKKPQEAKGAKSRAAKNTNAECGDSEKETITKVSKKTTSRTVKKKNDENARPIDLFFKKQPIKTVYSSPKIKTTTKPMNLSAFSIDFNSSHTMFDGDDMNLSEIINEMVSRPPNITELNGKKLKFDEIAAKEGGNSTETADKARGIQNNKQIHVENEKTEESMDEFDLIVMRKARKSIFAKRKSILASNLNEPKMNSCSTPMNRNHVSKLMEQSTDWNISPASETPKNRKRSVISSSFFAVNPDDEIDLFEKSVDFRNMQDIDSDEDPCDECEHESGESSKTSQQNDDDNSFNQYDTYDRLVGMA